MLAGLIGAALIPPRPAEAQSARHALVVGVNRGSAEDGLPALERAESDARDIAKALIAYLVYGKHFSFWDVYSDLSIEKVNAAVPGQLNGMFTGTAVGAVGTLYEAIVRK